MFNRPVAPTQTTIRNGSNSLRSPGSALDCWGRQAHTGPDTATHSFSIVLGEQPSMDFGGLRNADGQGFAVFGRVVRGLDVARKIQAQPADGQRLVVPVKIVRIAIRSPSAEVFP